MSSRSLINFSTRVLLILLASSGVVIALSSGLIRHSFAEKSASVQKNLGKVALSKSEVATRYGKLPLSFEPNQGQTDPQVKFLSRGQGYSLFLTSTGMVLSLREPQPPGSDNSKAPSPAGEISNTRTQYVLRLSMIGANPRARVEGQDQLPGKINYFVGGDRAKWHTEVPTYLKVHYSEVYPKVDLVYYGNQTELEYDFVVAPGGDVKAIRFLVEGADRVHLDRDGSLVVAIKKRELRMSKPVIYQLTDKGERREVKGQYIAKGNEIGFKVESYDSSKPLVIDPILSYSTLLGGAQHDHGTGIAVDALGNAYITGIAGSFSFPTTPGAFQTSNNFFNAAFVTKLDPTGTSLVYSTILGGTSAGATGTAIAVDPSGNAHVTGRTSARDFPLVNPLKTKNSFFKTTDGAATWTSNINGLTANVTALAVAPSSPNTIYAGTPSGLHKSTDSGLNWTRPTNTGLSAATISLAVDPTDPLIVYAGSVFGGLYKTTNGGGNWSTVSLPPPFSPTIFCVVFDPVTPSTIYVGSGNGVFKSTDSGSTWTTLNNFGIPGTPNVRALAIDPITPSTIYAGTFATGVFKTTNSGTSWTAINNGISGGSFPLYVNTVVIDPFNVSTLYAGSGFSQTGGSINKSVDGGANWSPVNTGVPNFAISVLVADSTTASTVYAATTGGGVIKTTNGGTIWSAVNSGLWKTNVSALVRDPSNSSTLFAGSGSDATDDDVFVSKLNAAGSALLFSTYLGGSVSDEGYGIALDGSGNVFVTGLTNSSNFPVVNAFQSSRSAGDSCTDAFVSKIDLAGPSLAFSTYFGGSGCDRGNGIATDSSGNVYITGSTGSTNFPVLSAFQPALGSTFNTDAFATKLNTNGTLAYSTYLGGNDLDSGASIAVDVSGNAYVTGHTSSSNYPTLNAIKATREGIDIFVTKLSPLGSALVYSTYLGGTNNDLGRGIALDSANNAYITGFADSADFPVMVGTLLNKSPLFKSTDGGASWNNDTFGLKGANVGNLTLHPTDPSTIFGSTSVGVFKSTDGGRNWTASSSGLTSQTIVGLVIDPLTPSTLYAASSFGSNPGVYKSLDGGATWNAVNTGLGNGGVSCLAIDPVTPTTLYAGWGGGVFKTTNGGTNWTNLGGLFSTSAIVIDPATPTTIYAAGNSSGGGVFKTINGGASWQPVNSGLTTTFILSLAIDPTSPTTIYAGGNGGLFKSVDGAASWTPITTGLTNTFITGITVDPVTPTTVYASSGVFSGGVFKSVNGGANWTPINNGLRYQFASRVLIDPTMPNRLFVGTQVFPGGNDAFVIKLNAAGNAMVYSTLLGNDEAFGIGVDSSGNAYIAGQTMAEFQVTPDSYQPFSRGFTDVWVAKLTMSYVISGQVLDGSNVPVSGAEIILSDGVSLRSVFTEGDGLYEFSQLREGGNFTVSAAKPNFTMAPPSQTFNNLTSNQTANFVATATNAPFYTISGQVTENSLGLGGVTVTLSGAQSGVRTTDSNGNYSFTLAGGSDYTVTPTKLGFSFTPTSLTFNGLSANQTADFSSTRHGFVVINTNNHGTGSLRQAILDANATAGVDTIVFNIPGSGVQTINLLIGLPVVTEPVVIDGTTQPGYAGTPIIELNGANAGSGASGLSISAGASTIRGLAINRFNHAGIFLATNGNNIIQGNYIGTDATGTLRRGNTSAGIIISQSSNNTIGGTSPAARNIISASSSGITLNGSSNVIQGNYIGTNAAGTAELGNGRGIDLFLVQFSTSINNVIGGTAAGAGNVISGNSTGIESLAPSTVIQGNLIGTDPTGTTAVPNGTGISSSGVDVLVGGTVPGARNVISGNLAGVRISGMQSKLQGNYIGTDITGTVALGNTIGGVFAGNHALIGGTTPEARNVISGNGGTGNVAIGNNISGDFPVTVQGNYIGTDVTGNLALTNPSVGIGVSSSNNVIGGLVAGARNVISGNIYGIQIGGFTSGGVFGNVVQGNLIGLNAAGNAPLPNKEQGVRLVGATGNVIGGTAPGAGNTIAFNGSSGVWVASDTNNSIRGNSIFSNAGLAIDLTPFNFAFPNGVTANDLNDADTGANNLQNFPLLTSVTPDGGGTSIQGTLNSTPNTTFQIDFYSNVACDPTGNGEGALFFDTTSVMTDANGNATINLASSAILPSGRVLTATATGPTGNTSEFSPCDSANTIGNLQFTVATYNVLEDVGAAVITVVRHGGSEGALSVDYNTADGTALAGSDYTSVSGTFNFADGETSKTFTIPIADDGVSESNETVNLVLTGFTDVETRGNPTVATMVIQDSNTPLFLLLDSIDVVEGDSGTTNGSVLVHLSAQTGRTVTADIGFLPTGATANVDFVAPSGSITFLPGVITQTITVEIIGDTLTEFNETFRVQLSNAVNAGVVDFSLVRIIDQDPLRIDGGTKAGRASGGQTIQLTGAFARLSTVKMGGTTATWFFGANSGIINVITPAHAVGPVQIDMTQTGGSPYSKPNAFAYLPTVFTDNTLVAGQTTAKAQHIIELRQAIDSLRAVAGLAPATWTDPTLSPASTIIKVVHIVELRSYLDDVATQLGYATSPYTDPSLGAGSVIKRIHLEELRQRIRTIAG